MNLIYFDPTINILYDTENLIHCHNDLKSL